MTAVIDDDHAREPDASVQRGAALDLDSMILDAPLIVVEVISPSTEHTDNDVKVAEYFSVPSIQHYLIVDPAKRVVIHHTRSRSGNVSTRESSSCEINLMPPGMTVPVAELLRDLG